MPHMVPVPSPDPRYGLRLGIKTGFSNVVFHDKAGQEKHYARDTWGGLESCVVRRAPEPPMCMGSTKNGN
jgi:hypothetical protein